MLATLLEARTSSLRNVAGACNNTPEFLQLLNDATRRLMRRGDWVGTIIPIHVCVRAGCVVWPRYVGEIRKVNVCNRPLDVNNIWYQFIDDRDYCGCGSRQQQWSDWWASICGSGLLRLNNQGRTPTFSDIYGDGRLVRAYPRCQADIGKFITLFGVDNNDQPLMTRNDDDTWSDGVTITLNTPFGSTSTYVRRIDRVLKDVTQCTVDLFAYNAALDQREPLATYEPGETNPSYRKDRLIQGPCSSGTCGCDRGIVALVKLQFIPARTDDDLVLIENLDALKLMMQAQKYEESGEREMAREYETDAIRELNLGLFDRDQYDMPVDLGEVGRTLFFSSQRVY